MRVRLVFVSFVFVLAVLISLTAACGGGGNGGPPPPPPPPQPTVSVSAQPSSTTEGGTSTVTASVTNGTLSNCSVPQGQGTLQMNGNSGPYTALATVNSNMSATVTCTGTGAGGTGTGTTTITVNAPTITITAPTAGSTVSGQVTLIAAFGNLNPNAAYQAQFKVDGTDAGQSVNVVGGSATLTWDSTSTGNGSHTLTAALVGRTIVSTGVSVTLNNPQGPTITSVVEANTGSLVVYCRSSCVRPFIITGTGFTAGQTIAVSNGVLFAEARISATQWNLSIKWDALSYDPGFSTITITDASAGKSASTNVAFLGNLPTSSCSATECFLNDQLNGKILVFDIVTGTKVREFSFGLASPQLAVDDATGLVAVSQGSSTVGAKRPSDGFTEKGADVGKPTMAIAAKAGFTCATQDLDDQVACLDLNPPNPPPPPVTTSTTVGDQPHPIAMGTLGSQLVLVTFSVEDLQFTTLKVPQMTIQGQGTINGLRKYSQFVANGEGGWQIALFSTGGASGTAAFLHQTDKVVVFINANSGAELGRFTFAASEFPFRIAADETHGTLIVALADVANKQTRFVKLTPGAAPVKTPLNATVGFLATGLAISADGSKLYLSNRDQFQVKNND